MKNIIFTTDRVENSGERPIVLIEGQSGSYLGEEDIVCYEDRYAHLIAN